MTPDEHADDGDGSLGSVASVLGRVRDGDSDGLDDAAERRHGSDPHDRDTDDDGDGLANLIDPTPSPAPAPERSPGGAGLVERDEWLFAPEAPGASSNPAPVDDPRSADVGLGEAVADLTVTPPPPVGVMSVPASSDEPVGPAPDGAAGGLAATSTIDPDPLLGEDQPDLEVGAFDADEWLVVTGSVDAEAAATGAGSTSWTDDAPLDP